MTSHRAQGVAADDALLAAKSARELDQPAFISVLSDVSIAALAAAAGPGPLAGIPFAIKDNIDLAGVPTTAADPNNVTAADASAAVVALLLEAGAVPVGKTNLDQYATGLVGTRTPYGACHSVYSAAHVSGGSSSGSAVAVASGLVPFALGTDTAGSGRVPAAFNGLVGLKPSRGALSTRGVVPACRSLDCVSVFAGSVAMARAVFDVAARHDELDPYSRPVPVRSPRLGAHARPVIGVPSADLGLDPLHEEAWQQAIARAGQFATLVPFDPEPLLAAAALLYSGPWVAERLAAFGDALEAPSGIDPTVRQIVLGARGMNADDAFRGMYRLAELQREADAIWPALDAILLPTTPTHPTAADVAAEPIAINSRLGRFTNMTNLLDLAALAVPGGTRADGLPFGVQFLAPAGSDLLLMDVGGRWLGEPALPTAPGADLERVQLAVAGAHLTGQPLNADLVARGGRFAYATRTAPDYRMFEVPGPIRRPGVTRVLHGPPSGPGLGVEVEVWTLPVEAVAGFLATIAPPLGIGPIELADGRQVLGFLCSADAADPARDISEYGGWRAYLAAVG
jgi:allophanate hydrolase